MQKQRTGGLIRMESKAMGIMVKVLVLPGRFSRHSTCGSQTQCVPAEPLLPPDQYHPAMVGHVLSLVFDKSKFPPRNASHVIDHYDERRCFPAGVCCITCLAPYQLSIFEGTPS